MNNEPISPAEARAREIIAGNLSVLMRRSTDKKTQAQLEVAAGVSGTTVYRILNRRASPTSDTLALLAEAFGLEAFHLLVDGLDPANPQKLPNLPGGDDAATDFDLLSSPELTQWIGKRPGKDLSL